MNRTRANTNLDVVILCGGKGLRLQPLTAEIPKPLVYLKDQPMLKHILDVFHRWHYYNFYLCIGYKGYMIKDYFKDKRLPYNIHYDDAGENASMLERLLSVQPLIPGDRFVLAFGDALADVNLRQLVEYHCRMKSLLTVTVLKHRSSFGIVKFNKYGKVRTFEEKPMLDHWINIGFMVIEKSFLKNMLRSETMVDLYQKAIDTRRCHAFQHEGEHLTVNTNRERIETENKLEGFYTIIDNVTEVSRRCAEE